MKEKIEMYEGLLHDIQMYSQVAINHERLGQLISNINHWSYAHRCGNGENSEKEQNKIIERNFKKLRDIKS
jgi:hypothetical protein